jgi:hypothetical protein
VAWNVCPGLPVRYFLQFRHPQVLIDRITEVHQAACWLSSHVLYGTPDPSTNTQQIPDAQHTHPLAACWLSSHVLYGTPVLEYTSSARRILRASLGCSREALTGSTDASLAWDAMSESSMRLSPAASAAAADRWPR